MSEETLRTTNRRAIWLGIAITLGPLAVMPLASRPGAEQAQAPGQIVAQVAMQGVAQSALSVAATGPERGA
jgi:hypothetical protein